MFLEPSRAAELAASWDAVAGIGGSELPLMAVDIRGHARPDVGVDAHDRLADALPIAPWVNVALVDPEIDPTLVELVDAFDIVLCPETSAPAPAAVAIAVADPHGELAAIEQAVRSSPQAAVALVQLLRLAEHRPVPIGLHAESLTYGLLQTGATFQAWLAERRPAPPPADDGRVVRIVAEAGLLTITLDRAHRRNALNVAMRDQLIEAFELLELDRSLDGALLVGDGPNFSAGGDLDEFGTTPSAAVGHHVRTVRSLPRLVHRLRDRIRVHVHGTCVGAGIEVPAFAHAVLADPDTTFRLPEVGFGLVPGAGGTVSVSRRCGRHRTAWWAIRGHAIDARTALSWGLVDRIASRV